MSQGLSVGHGCYHTTTMCGMCQNNIMYVDFYIVTTPYCPSTENLPQNYLVIVRATVDAFDDPGSPLEQVTKVSIPPR